MVNIKIILFGVFGVFILENLILMLWYAISKQWDIPIVILRFVGNKGRPMLLNRKGKKTIERGVPVLRVKGYEDSIRDFKSEYYFPTEKSKYGAMILWEFEDGYLTPAIPTHAKDNLTDEQKKELKKILDEIRSTEWVSFEFETPWFRRFMTWFFSKIICSNKRLKEKIILKEPEKAIITRLENSTAKINAAQTVKFDFDTLLYRQLKLKAVDDVDIEWMLQQKARIDNQYVAGWRDFLAKYGGHIALILIAAMMLIGVIFVVIKLPEIMSACSGAGMEAAKNVLQDLAKNIVAPSG